MRKETVLIFIFSLILAGALLHGIGASQIEVEPKTIVVPDEYLSIQAAVDAASTGDTISVRNGIYHEHVVINKTVSIVGESKEATVVDGNGSGIVFEVIFASNASIENLTFRNGDFGLYIFQSTYVKLRNTNSADNKYNFALIANTTAPQNLVHDIDTSNTVDSKPIYFWTDRKNTPVPQDAGFVALVNCSNITVRGLTLTSNGNGILLAYVRNSVIENVNISDTLEALYLDITDHCTVQSNSITNNKRAITIKNSNDNNFTENIVVDNGDNDAISVNNASNNVFRRNIISNNSHAGIELSSSFSNLIIENDMTNNWYGINLLNCQYNNLTKNQATANGYQNIWLWNSEHNVISQNTIAGNKSGSNIPGQKGIGLGISNSNIITENVIEHNYFGIEVYDSTNNLIYHNDFINNTYQTRFPNYWFANSWDNGLPSSGNYWTDYNGSDSDHDGTGDSPYNINENNIDRYPSMTPYIVPEFQSALVILLFTTMTLLAAGVCRRRHD